MTRIEVPGRDVVGLRADNPGPLTLSGTNSWVVGRDPAWVIDPGPPIEAHLSAITDECAARGGAGGIALTHSHADHAQAAPELARRLGVPVGAGPLDVLPLPGHASDHVVFLSGDVAFTGDAVLGEGSVFVSAQMRDYLDGLAALRARRPAFICPGHGPLVTDPIAKLDEYRDHRLGRERAVRAAIDRGARSVDELLDAAWPEVPAELRPVAAVTLAAHLEALGDAVPADVERPERPDWL